MTEPVQLSEYNDNWNTLRIYVICAEVFVRCGIRVSVDLTDTVWKSTDVETNGSLATAPSIDK